MQLGTSLVYREPFTQSFLHPRRGQNRSAPVHYSGDMALSNSARARNIVPMGRSSSRFTTRGTPYMGKTSAFAERQNSREASTSFAIYPTGPLAVSLRG